MSKSNQLSGFSLLEMLVVLTVFGILALISSQTLILTLRGVKKANSIATVRINTDYAIAVMERQLHNASQVEETECDSTQRSVINFKDGDGGDNSFSCEDIGESGYVASASARLTGPEVSITSCSFVCEPETASIPPAVTISLEASTVGLTGPEAGQITTSTTIFLRSY